MVRVDGGFILLNYLRYRDRDYSNAERQRRFRDRKRNASPTNGVIVTPVTHAHADADKILTPLPPLGIKPVESQKQNQTTEQGTPHDLPPESLAHKVIEAFNLSSMANVLRAVAAAIRAMAGEKKCRIAEGCDALIEVSTRAQAAGKAINYLWFMNTGWREWEAKQAKAAEPKKRPKSPMQQLAEQQAEVFRMQAEKAAQELTEAQADGVAESDFSRVSILEKRATALRERAEEAERKVARFKSETAPTGERKASGQAARQAAHAGGGAPAAGQTLQ